MIFLVRMVSLLVIAFVILCCLVTCNNATHKPPNIVIVMADDIGYGDFKYTGHPTQERNEIDQLASEGLTFTRYMAAGILCTPNRAAMLTGIYPVRYGLYGSVTPVFLPSMSTGLPKSEITIAEALTDIGYKTAMVGKWHLGINEHNSSDGSHLPVNHGFDYVGLNLPMSYSSQCNFNRLPIEEQAPWCALYNGSSIIEQPYDTRTLGPRLLDDAKSFIRRNKKHPFFLFASWPHPHDISFSSNRFAGKSMRGHVGDSINELAWMTGEIIKEIKRNLLEKRTLVLFLNDHGPSNWGCQPNFSNGPFRGRGGTGCEGAIRGPAIAWWPGRIQSGETSEIFSVLDVFPTILRLTGFPKYLKDRNVTYDGKVIRAIAAQKQKPARTRFLVHYCGSKIMAVRLNQYKMHFNTNNFIIPLTVESENKFCNFKNIGWISNQLRCDGPNVEANDPPLLFNTDEDPGESFPLDLDKYSSVFKKIRKRLILHKNTVKIANTGLLDAPLNWSLAPCCFPPKCICPALTLL